MFKYWVLRKFSTFRLNLPWKNSTQNCIIFHEAAKKGQPTKLDFFFKQVFFLGIYTIDECVCVRTNEWVTAFRLYPLIKILHLSMDKIVFIMVCPLPSPLVNINAPFLIQFALQRFLIFVHKFYTIFIDKRNHTGSMNGVDIYFSLWYFYG